MKPTLVVLAAGMGSRYGSLKQMDGVGPSKEAIIDYSIYDAIRAGFGKVVFVIRHLFEKEFREIFSAERFGGRIEVEFVFQELDYLPKGYTIPEGREKPWGTNHAVIMAAPVVDVPFAVINSDDFYGREGYQVLGDYLRSVEGKKGHYSMVGYNLRNTLSEFGSVSRGECTVDTDGNLVNIVERLGIERQAAECTCACGKTLPKGTVTYKEADGLHPIDENTPVSMNLFGFTPDYFAESERLFIDFLNDPANMANPKSEYFIPKAVNSLITEGKAHMKVLNSDAKWFGVTYKEDRPDVVAKIQKLVDEGVYPSNLWAK